MPRTRHESRGACRDGLKKLGQQCMCIGVRVGPFARARSGDIQHLDVVIADETAQGSDGLSLSQSGGVEQNMGLALLPTILCRQACTALEYRVEYDCGAVRIDDVLPRTFSITRANQLSNRIQGRNRTLFAATPLRTPTAATGAAIQRGSQCSLVDSGLAAGDDRERRLFYGGVPCHQYAVG